MLNGAWGGYAGNAQHTALSAVASQPLESIHWQAPVDLDPQFSGNDLFIHYGSPAITTAGTLLLPVKTGASGGFEVQGRNERDGTLLWTIPTDYVLPAARLDAELLARPHAGRHRSRWRRTAAGSTWSTRPIRRRRRSRGRLPSSARRTTRPTRRPTTANVFDQHAASRPTTRGNLYFGYTVTGANPLNLQSGIARIARRRHRDVRRGHDRGRATRGSSRSSRTPPRPLATTARRSTSPSARAASGGGDLLALDSTTLATTGKVALMDPKSNTTPSCPTTSTASPLVGPDGDVYFGVLENPFASNHDRGWLLHFNCRRSR